MTTTSETFDLSGFGAELTEAQAALRAFVQGPVRESTREIGDAFDKAGARIVRAMARAGGDGAMSMKQLAKIVLEELAKIALGNLLGQSGQSAPFFGARAAGGSVTRGGAYLVGERGPELFTPASSGTILPAGGAVQVHFHLGAGADAASIARHQGQIAAQIARAVAYGRRNL